MKFNAKMLVSKLQSYLTKFIGGLLMLTLVSHSIFLGGNTAILLPEGYVSTSPLLATSTSSISKQMTGKAEEVKGSAEQRIGKAQSRIEDKAGAAKMKVKDDLTEAKIIVDSSAARVENTADKATTAVKNFFGK
jgi:uncharacterized protein YjbJ (UPF0337 family)